MKRLEQQLGEEIDKLFNLAENQYEKENHIDLDIPEEINRIQGRLEKIKKPKEVVEARTAERAEQEKKEYDAKMKERKDQQEKTGKKPRGRTPKEPIKEPMNKDQYNFTDPQSRIMRTSDGLDQCFNAQAAVTDDMIIVGGRTPMHMQMINRNLYLRLIRFQKNWEKYLWQLQIMDTLARIISLKGRIM